MTEYRALDKLYNRYSLVARVYPALLTLGPILWSTLVLFPTLVSDLRNGTASVLAVGCLLYLLSSVARSRGKLAERHLLERWGGWPTTVFLRHRDASIDPITKARYHAALAVVANIPALPTAAEELATPEEADHVYRSMTKRLIEIRRGSAFQMVEDENASYGFRRNLFGLKFTAVAVSLLATLTTAVVWWASITKPVNVARFETSIKTYPHLPVLVAADLSYSILLVCLVTQEFVRQAADEYASALFRTLDQAAGHTPRARQRKTRS